jgi:hypothetical protein
MQLSQEVIISIAALMATVSAENILVALNSDIGSNVQQYLSFVQANTGANVAPLLSLYQQAQTYTDNSYTTLVNEQELASISAFATNLPWYSSRLLPELAASATVASETASSVIASKESSISSVLSSEKPSISSALSSAHSSFTSAHSSIVPTTSHEISHSSKTESASKTETKSSVSTAGAAYVAPGVGLLALGAIALL